MRPPAEFRCRGVALLVLMLILMLMGIALARAATWWAIERQRDDETQLLYVGNEYRLAIQRYYYATPAAAKTYPTRLEDLLEDPRFPIPVHHLRRLYLDPMTSEPFKPVLLGDQIIGVVSKSRKRPIKRRNFQAPYGFFNDQDSYTEWRFSFAPPESRSSVSNAVLPYQQTAGVKP